MRQCQCQWQVSNHGFVSQCPRPPSRPGGWILEAKPNKPHHPRNFWSLLLQIEVRVNLWSKPSSLTNLLLAPEWASTSLVPFSTLIAWASLHALALVRFWIWSANYFQLHISHQPHTECFNDFNKYNSVQQQRMFRYISNTIAPSQAPPTGQGTVRHWSTGCFRKPPGTSRWSRFSSFATITHPLLRADRGAVAPMSSVSGLNVILQKIQ